MKQKIAVLFVFIAFVLDMSAQTERLNLKGGASLPIVATYLDGLTILVGVTNYGYQFFDVSLNIDNKLLDSPISSNVTSNYLYYFLPVSNSVKMYNKITQDNLEIKPIAGSILRSMAANNSSLAIGLYGLGVIVADLKNRSFIYKNKNLGFPDVTNVSKYQDSILFATTQSGGFFISSFDSTSDWQQKNNGLDNTIINQLTHNNKDIYVVVGANKLYSSQNFGENWQRVNFPYPNNIIVSIKMLENTLYVATKNNGIYSTDNKGVSWHQIGNFKEKITITTFDINSNIIAVGTEEDGFFWSTNSGNSWEQKLFKSKEEIVGVRKILNIGNDMYVGTEKDGIFFSSNGGNKFMRTGFLNPGDFIFDMTEKNQKIFAASLYGGIYKSTDYGASWKSANIGILNKRTTRLTWIDDTLVAATDGGGVNISTDWGESWTQRNSGLGFTYLSAVHYNNGRLFAISYGGGLYYSDNNGFNWKQATGISDKYTIKLASDANTLYLGTYTEGLFVSKDNGTTWMRRQNQGAIYDILVFDDFVFYGIYHSGLYLSRDKGVSFNSVNEYTGDKEILSLSMDKNYLYIGTSIGMYRLNFKSLNIKSVPEIKLDTKNDMFLIYPNPCKDELFVQSKAGPTFNFIDIYDLNGLLLIRQNVINQTELRIDISNLPSGFYLIKGGDLGKIFVKE